MADGTADGSVGNLTSEIGGLDMTDSGPQQPRPFITAINDLDQTVDSLKQQLDNFKTLLVNNSLTDGEVTTTCRVSEQVNSIRNVAQGLSNAVIQSIVTHITSLEKRKSPETLKLLEQYDILIKMIVVKFVVRRNDADTLWKIIEECCIQAVPSGELDPDDYVASIPEPEPQSHSDKYTEARQRLVEDNKKRIRDDWYRFWAQCLNKCPSGPTLFIPLKDRSPSGSPLSTAENPPRYLFMPYDFVSPGTNSKDIFTSEAHNAHGSARSKKDIFSMGTDDASKMLHRHLDGPTARTDNLVTWSRSLLFVLQAAVHRCCNTHGHNPNKILICILDTSKFPKGQFVSAKWLREKCSQTTPEKEETRCRKHLFNYALWISQGVLDVKGRSCTLSLQSLQQSGLGSLYQELAISTEPDALARKELRDYLIALDKRWKSPCETTRNEIAVAINIAEECFGSFDKLDIALLLLSLRKRRIEIDGKLHTLGVMERMANSLKRKGRRAILVGVPKEGRRYLSLKCKLAELSRMGTRDAFTCLAEVFVLSSGDGT